MTPAAATKSTIPIILGWASQYPRRDRTETKTTYAARAKSKPPAVRAARFSVSEGLEVDRKRQKITAAAAESSSIALSPPKARRAGLRDVQAAPSETAASTLIQIIVNTWSPRTRRETSGTGGDVAMAMGSPFFLLLCVAHARRTQPATSQSSLFHGREENRHQNQHVNGGRDHAAPNRGGNWLHHVRTHASPRSATART